MQFLQIQNFIFQIKFKHFFGSSIKTFFKLNSILSKVSKNNQIHEIL